MLALNIVLYALWGTSLAFALIELGLSAYVTSAYSGTQEVATWSAYSGYSYTDFQVKPPGIIIFLVFSSCWTVLVTIAALLVPWYYSRKGFMTAKLNTVLAATFVAIYFVTMVFWLACFADIANILTGVTSINPYFSAIIAFAVLLWLLFVALLVFTILAMCGILVSDWPGYQSVRKEKAVAANAGASHGEPMTEQPNP
ncbi:hypothetical protein N7457_003785 [Penicillium paradoxum]|uniref:uncharacterized protein n=1 Tax=Penicillium paradoxum TaxID=176176 RepID=UPI002547BA8E|nr:uncharacterized protein N7457_003785 [Penicillium paradoxum]KAJ5782011.1 hypothetical protein N7457_003785 [Penicillium paradoxum]